MSHLIAPSVLSADFLSLASEIKMLNNSEADWLHLDVMDGVFVPNISFGFPVIKAIQKIATKPLDIHLMIVEPDRYIKEFSDLGAHVITVHYEACIHLHRTIQKIKQLNCKAGVALNPHTPVSLLENIIQDIDLVCIMSVNPGYGGQKFIEESYSKIKALKSLIEANNSSALIEVDGGVDINNAGELLNSGADVLVAGSSVFGSENPNDTINVLKQIHA